MKLPIFVCANRVRSRPSSSVGFAATNPLGEGFGRMRTLIVAVLQVKASCFSRTVGDAGPYKFVRTGCDFPQQMIFSRSRKRTYHICAANISLRSNITCPKGANFTALLPCSCALGTPKICGSNSAVRCFLTNSVLVAPNSAE